MERNPADRTKLLVPCHGMTERVASGGYYAFGWGGGLPEAITTEVHATKEAALTELKQLLFRAGRKIEE